MGRPTREDTSGETIGRMAAYMRLASPTWWRAYKSQRAWARTYREIADDFEGEQFVAMRAEAVRVADHTEAIKKATGRAYWETYYWLSGISKSLVRGLPGPGFDPAKIDPEAVARAVMTSLCNAKERLGMTQSQWSEAVEKHRSECEIPT